MSVTNADIKKLLEEQKDEKSEIKEEIEKLNTKFENFQEQYDLDMRGDTIPNGNKGIVNELSGILKILKDSPSLLFLVQHNPWKSFMAIISFFTFMTAFWFVLHAIVTIPGVEEFFQNLLKLPSPEELSLQTNLYLFEFLK
jgi:hypothetical protein